jgi:hypothetical protein
MIGNIRHLPTSAALLVLMPTAGPGVGQESWSLRADRSVGAFGGPVEFGSSSGVVVGPRGVYVGDDMNGRIVILAHRPRARSLEELTKRPWPYRRTSSRSTAWSRTRTGPCCYGAEASAWTRSSGVHDLHGPAGLDRDPLRKIRGRREI